jgi:acetyl-CoA acetyltransferase
MSGQSDLCIGGGVESMSRVPMGADGGAMAIDPHVIFPLPSDVAVVWLLTGVGTLMLGGAVFAAIYKPDTSG